MLDLLSCQLYHASPPPCSTGYYFRSEYSVLTEGSSRPETNLRSILLENPLEQLGPTPRNQPFPYLAGPRGTMYDDDAGRLKRFLNTFPLWIFLPFDTLSSKNFFYFIFFFLSLYPVVNYPHSPGCFIFRNHTCRMGLSLMIHDLSQ